MSIDEARKMLEVYFTSQASFQSERGLDIDIKLPIVDERINTIGYSDKLNFVFEQWTFKGLLKTAYNLKDND